MGVFDYLTIEHELPDGFDPEGVEFQTKDTAAQYLEHYVLRADGALVNAKTGEQEFHHGVLEFHASNWAGSCGLLYMTSDDLPPWSAEYVALYDHGKLIRIEGGTAPVEGVEHVLRADFDRRTAEYRKEGRTPEEIEVDEVHRDWVHWMSLNRDHFEAVKPPALAVRLHYLWSNCAWGHSGHDDAAELRQWSEWLGQQDFLTPEAKKLLRRARAALAALPRAPASE